MKTIKTNKENNISYSSNKTEKKDLYSLGNVNFLNKIFGVNMYEESSPYDLMNEEDCVERNLKIQNYFLIDDIKTSVTENRINFYLRDLIHLSKDAYKNLIYMSGINFTKVVLENKTLRTKLYDSFNDKIYHIIESFNNVYSDIFKITKYKFIIKGKNTNNNFSIIFLSKVLSNEAYQRYKISYQTNWVNEPILLENFFIDIVPNNSNATNYLISEYSKYKGFYQRIGYTSPLIVLQKNDYFVFSMISYLKFSANKILKFYGKNLFPSLLVQVL